MGLPYFAAIRFLPDCSADDLWNEMVRASKAACGDVHSGVSFSLVATGIPMEARHTSTIVSLKSAILQTAASRTLGFLGLETETNGVHENWCLIPRFTAPCWLELRFDSLTSSAPSDERICARLRGLVDEGAMDLVICPGFYYGFGPLLFLFRKTRDAERGIGEPVEGLLESLGPLENVRGLTPERVTSRQMKGWMRNWERRRSA